MTSRRPGAPRTARRPVSASGASRSARSSGRGARGGGGSSRPAAASRPRSTQRSSADPDGPGITITRRTLVLITLVVVALAALVPTINSYVAQRQQLSQLRSQVSQQQDDVDALQEQVDRWEDPAYVQAQARERLLFAMPGETQYRLTDTSGEDVPLTAEEEAKQSAAQGAWFSALWDSVEGASRLTAEDIPEDDTTPGDTTDSEDSPE